MHSHVHVYMCTEQAGLKRLVLARAFFSVLESSGEIHVCTFVYAYTRTLAHFLFRPVAISRSLTYVHSQHRHIRHLFLGMAFLSRPQCGSSSWCRSSWLLSSSMMFMAETACRPNAYPSSPANARACERTYMYLERCTCMSVWDCERASLLRVLVKVRLHIEASTPNMNNAWNVTHMYAYRFHALWMSG